MYCRFASQSVWSLFIFTFHWVQCLCCMIPCNKNDNKDEHPSQGESVVYYMVLATLRDLLERVICCGKWRQLCQLAEKYCNFVTAILISTFDQKIWQLFHSNPNLNIRPKKHVKYVTVIPISTFYLKTLQRNSTSMSLSPSFSSY